jgi:hypothetical protein
MTQAAVTLIPKVTNATGQNGSRALRALASKAAAPSNDLASTSETDMFPPRIQIATIKDLQEMCRAAVTPITEFQRWSHGDLHASAEHGVSPANSAIHCGSPNDCESGRHHDNPKADNRDAINPL